MQELVNGQESNSSPSTYEVAPLTPTSPAPAVLSISAVQTYAWDTSLNSNCL